MSLQQKINNEYLCLRAISYEECKFDLELAFFVSLWLHFLHILFITIIVQVTRINLDKTPGLDYTWLIFEHLMENDIDLLCSQNIINSF